MVVTCVVRRDLASIKRRISGGSKLKGKNSKIRGEKRQWLVMLMMKDKVKEKNNKTHIYKPMVVIV